MNLYHLCFANKSESFRFSLTHALQRSIIYGVGLNDANLPGGIQSTLIYTDKCSWQVGYSPAIAKDSFKTLTMNYTLSWGRYDPE